MRLPGDTTDPPFDPAPWVTYAACKDMDTNLFFPEQGVSNAAALAACARCPVARQCLQYCESMNVRIGVWGGMSERQRRKARMARMGVRSNRTCGTLSGYSDGCRCAPCREAKAVHKAEIYALRKVSA